MKKMLMQFAGNLLSKEQMKVVKGGDSYDGGSSGTGSGGSACSGGTSYYYCRGTLGGYNMSGGVCATSASSARNQYVNWLSSQTSMTGLTGYAPFNNCS